MILNWTWGRLPKTPSAHGSFAQVGDLHVRYVEQKGAEPAVLLLHGQPGTAEDMLSGSHMQPYTHPEAVASAVGRVAAAAAPNPARRG